MKKKLLALAALITLFVEGSGLPAAGFAESSGAKGGNGRPAAVVADHTSAKLDQIPVKWVEAAKKDLHIAYGHTSHGSQITTGLIGLTSFRGEPFIYKKGSPKGSLDIRDNPFGGEKDLGNPDNRTWAQETRKYLDNNKDINVVMWSWCGQLSGGDSKFVQNYLDLMQGLESQYPDVTFVYMTGHLDGTGEEGVLFKNNSTIREFCKKNNRVLYDFADIESYDPDGNYYAGKYGNFDCYFDSNGDKQRDQNWAMIWQKTHTKGVDWYACEAAHTEPLNANLKAYAFWWLAAKLAEQDSSAVAAGLAGDGSFDYYAEKLKSLDLFTGTANGFELDRVPTRLEGAVMLTRLIGGEKDAKSINYSHPFKDAAKSWGSSYIGYLYQKKLVAGISRSSYGCDLKLDAASYITILLRVLGYSDSPAVGDFKWGSAAQAAREFGVIDEAYFKTLRDGVFNRGHMAKLTCLTLNHKLKGSGTTLLEKLVSDRVIDGKAAESF